MSDNFKTYLFEYGFEGDRWSFDIRARSPEEAEARLKALTWARYNGELIMTIPAPAGFLARLIVDVRNALYAGRGA